MPLILDYASAASRLLLPMMYSLHPGVFTISGGAEIFFTMFKSICSSTNFAVLIGLLIPLITMEKMSGLSFELII